MPDLRWDERNIPDLSGKVALVTGGNGGVGFETVKLLAQRGARVIMASRSEERGQAAKKLLLAQGITGKIDVLPLELGSLASIRALGEKVNQRYDRLDYLINNAGIMMCPYGTTEDGFERQMGVNHLGHFALTGRLLSLMEASGEARIITLSSRRHVDDALTFPDIYHTSANYSPIKAYGRSKLANLLFAYELDRRLREAGKKVRSLAAHPGRANTNIGTYLFGNPVMSFLKRPMLAIMSQPARISALSPVRAAVDPGASGGECFAPSLRDHKHGYPSRAITHERSYDRETAIRLWERSEDLTGVRYSL